MTGYVFRHAWPVGDLSAPGATQRLRVGAAREIDAVARRAGCTIVAGAHITWRQTLTELTAEAAARPFRDDAHVHRVEGDAA